MHTCISNDPSNGCITIMLSVAGLSTLTTSFSLLPQEIQRFETWVAKQQSTYNPILCLQVVSYAQMYTTLPLR